MLSIARHNSVVLICIVLLLIAGVVVRVGFAHISPIVVAPDTFGYYSIGLDIWSHPDIKTIINPWRTPVYPALLAGLAHAGSGNDLRIGSPGFEPVKHLTVLLQSFAGIVSIILLFITLVHFRFSLKYSFLFCFFQMINPLLFVWERILLTESLAASLGIVTVCAGLFLLRRPSTILFVLMTILSVIQFLLRPAFILAPLGIFPVIAWYHKSTRITVISLVCLAVTFLVPLAYAKSVENSWGMFTIQTSGTISQFGKILYDNLPVSSAAAIEPLYTQVREFRTTNLARDPFVFFEYHGITDYNNIRYLTMLNAFNSAVIRSNIPLYLLSMVRHLPVMLTATTDFSSPFASKDPLAGFLRFLFIPMQIVRYLSLAVVVFFPMAFVRFVDKKQDFRESAAFFFGAFALAQLVVIMSVQLDVAVGRYLSVYFIEITFFCFFWWKRSITSFLRHLHPVPGVRFLKTFFQ